MTDARRKGRRKGGKERGMKGRKERLGKHHYIYHHA